MVNASFAQLKRANKYYDNYEYAKAIQFAEQSLKVAPTDPFIYGNLSSMIQPSTETVLKIHIFSKHLQFLNYQDMAEAVAEMGFDGIDINMGCPDKSIEKQGAGSAHIKNPKLAQEVILAAMRC